MHRLEFLKANIKPGTILDVGNLDKNGAIHASLIKQFPTSTFYGLDILDQKDLGVHFDNQKVGSFENIDYPENTFDTIYIGEVIEHTWRPYDVIAACYKTLKPGGRLILDTPNVYSLSRMVRFFMTGMDIILGNAQHKIFFSPAMLDNLLKTAGFTVTKIESEVNFDTRRLKCKLPNVGSFKMMGECLLVLAEKPAK